MRDTRTPLARVRGLGVARAGVGHWWTQRVTAVLLIPLVLWFVAGLVYHTGADHAAVTLWLGNPVTYGLMLVLLGATFWHAALGLQVVIEDYVHGEAPKIALILLSQAVCLGLFVAAFISLTIIAFAG
ncbi:MAG: succinate dehydrogenase / fumarate reductase, rane anchor subunit [Rhodospirillaceae bacterium]|jgi:succinate dehydrogenase / fumarate reductase, membrane anchor subunit|nr:succinate dehydrogenase / fumarate reductase, rane anchor subunit [Rhodospirillaceae bacterium]